MTAKLCIEAYWNGEELTGGRLIFPPRAGVSRVMIGKRIQDAVDAMPRLFSLCGKAQGVASVMAAEAAMGVEVSASVRSGRMRLAEYEMLQEHLWRILLDWPLLAGSEPQLRLAAEMRTRIEVMQKPLLDSGAWKAVGGKIQAKEAGALHLGGFSGLFGMAPSAWHEMDAPQAIERWCAQEDSWLSQVLRGFSQAARFGASDVSFISAPDERALLELARAMDDDMEFSHRPHWLGAAAETGALARQIRHPLIGSLYSGEGNSVFARNMARLSEVFGSLAGKSCAMMGSLQLGKGKGIAWVETARGLLIHRVTTEKERVLDYRIVAPTEWNFHPDGAMIKGLRGIRASCEKEASKRAEALLSSLDPCLEYELALRAI